MNIDKVEQDPESGLILNDKIRIKGSAPCLTRDKVLTVSRNIDGSNIESILLNSK